jgi:hypothetical protein
MTITTYITGILLLKWLAAVCVLLDGVGAAPSPPPPTCDVDLFEQPGALNHCACGEDSAVFNIDKARMHLDDCCVVNMYVSLASAAAATGKATCPESSKCCISATDIPVYALGLAARQHAEMSFVASVESYVLPGSRYDRWI